MFVNIITFVSSSAELLHKTWRF